ncbi:glycosyltransferase family 87 protein [Streptomyces sp. CT34]|uniref:glycosyltransferase family 87 protein n=1 Tax=Streptomyces sp. CT34 TaxID=1553907 RepID=UPI00099BABE9|nr:glycosyltransferase family 87 protein [Streptomyces sp. CT34]
MSAEEPGKSVISGELAGRSAGESGVEPAAESVLAGWLCGRASWGLRSVAGGLLAVLVWELHRTSPTLGMDNDFVVRAARALLDGGAPYADKRFLYLPSAVLAAVPEALLGPRELRLLVPVAGAAAVLVGWWASLRIFRVGAGSRLAALGVVGLVFFEPLRNVVNIGNWTLASVVALPVAVLCAVRGRWTAAGAVVGCALAIKPMLVPLLLLFVLARRGRALAVAAGIPVAASVAAALVMPRPAMFFTHTLPFLLRGQDAFARPYDASVGMILTRLGVPAPLAYGVAVLAAAVGLGCARVRWRRAGGGPRRLVETAAMLMLAAFLVSRPSFDHYLLVVLGPLLASVVAAGSVPRTAWFWCALLPQVSGFAWPHLEAIQRRAFRDAAALWLLAGVTAWICAARWRAPVAAAGPAEESAGGREPVRGAF